jgi:hypothetical protein
VKNEIPRGRWTGAISILPRLEASSTILRLSAKKLAYLNHPRRERLMPTPAIRRDLLEGPAGNCAIARVRI